MQITNEMIQASVQKATELGVLPRQAHMEDLATNTEIMLEILQAALPADQHLSHNGSQESHSY